jgi:L,D-transpeptidase catalytic domain
MPLTSETFHTSTPKSLFVGALSFCALFACASLPAGCQRQGRPSARVAAAPAAAAPAQVPPAPDAGTERPSAEQEAANLKPLKLPLVNPQIVVRKAARRLTLFSGGEAVRVYPVVLGFTPEGDKERQGDGRTPEGTFYVCVKNDKSNFYLSLGLTYPDAEDAARGLRDGLINRKQHDRIARAASRKARPPWDTALGGEIFIHGGGTSSDWTAGCVALDNAHVKELFDSVPMGTPVRIEP